MSSMYFMALPPVVDGSYLTDERVRPDRQHSRNFLRHRPDGDNFANYRPLHRPFR